MVISHASVAFLLACAARPKSMVPIRCIARRRTHLDAESESSCDGLVRCVFQFSSETRHQASNASNGYANPSTPLVPGPGPDPGSHSQINGELYPSLTQGPSPTLSNGSSTTVDRDVPLVTRISAMSPSIFERVLWYAFLAGTVSIQGVATGGIALVVWPALVGLAVCLASTEGTRGTRAAGRYAFCLGGCCGCGEATARTSWRSDRFARHHMLHRGAGAPRHLGDKEDLQAELGGLFVLIHGWIGMVTASAASRAEQERTGSPQN